MLESVPRLIRQRRCFLLHVDYQDPVIIQEHAHGSKDHYLLAKIPFKAKEGLRDFLGNVQGKEAPISVNLETRDVVQANCMSCHRVTNQDVMMAKPYCVDCHRGMAHQKKTPVSFREAADE